MTQLSRRQFLTQAPAAAALGAAAPGREEDPHPHAVTLRDNGRVALPEERAAYQHGSTTLQALRAVLDLHGPGCDDRAGCFVCSDVKGVIWTLEVALSCLDGLFIGGLSDDFIVAQGDD